MPSILPPMPSTAPMVVHTTPPLPFMLLCRPPHPDRSILPCRPPYPDYHGYISPGCPWHPCSICVARSGRVCHPTLHDCHAAGVVSCGSAKTSAPPQGSTRTHQVCGRLSWQRPLKVSARRGERCTHRPWTSDLSTVVLCPLNLQTRWRTYFARTWYR